MRVIVQRVQSSRVEIDGEVSGEIGQGLMVLLGITEGDGQEQCDFWPINLSICVFSRMSRKR